MKQYFKVHSANALTVFQSHEFVFFEGDSATETKAALVRARGIAARSGGRLSVSKGSAWTDGVRVIGEFEFDDAAIFGVGISPRLERAMA